MKSRITIEMDFDQSIPVISVSSADSEDVRDKLVKVFREKLGYTSNWARIDFQAPTDTAVRFNIVPITPEGMENEAKQMLKQAGLNIEFPERQAIEH